MNDQQLKQRIAYLVEHGGIAEVDPLIEIRRDIRRLFALAAIGVSCAVVTLAVHLT